MKIKKGQLSITSAQFVGVGQSGFVALSAPTETFVDLSFLRPKLKRPGYAGGDVNEIKQSTLVLAVSVSISLQYQICPLCQAQLMAVADTDSKNLATPQQSPYHQVA